ERLFPRKFSNARRRYINEHRGGGLDGDENPDSGRVDADDVDGVDDEKDVDHAFARADEDVGREQPAQRIWKGLPDMTYVDRLLIWDHRNANARGNEQRHEGQHDRDREP